MSKRRLANIRKSQQSISFDEALTEFLIIQKGKGLSPRTLSDYESYARRFYNRFPYFPEVTGMRRAVSEWLSEAISPYTYNLRLTYNKKFFRFCADKGYLTENPMQDYTTRHTEPRIVHRSIDDLQRLLSQPDQSTFVGLRDYTMILLTLDTGIRPSEIRQLRSADFDDQSGLIRVPAEVSKSRTGRVLPVQPITITAIRRLLSVKPDTWKHTPLFCTNEGGILAAISWQNRVSLYSLKIGVKITPYDLRHCFALIYLKNGGNVFSLQKMMGHATLEMTKRYIDLDTDALKSMAELASPLTSIIVTKRRL